MSDPVLNHNKSHFQRASTFANINYYTRTVYLYSR